MSISIPGADYTPQLTGYTGQGAFRFWCQKVLPLVYDDSLSYYELLAKVVVYLNNVIKDVSTAEDNIGSLDTAFKLLQEYVNNYALVVNPETVERILSEHPEWTTTVQDGSLTETKFTNGLKNKTIKDYVTPEMYGAVGNGDDENPVDDTEAIQEAIDSGKTVVLCSKTYKISTLELGCNVSIVGLNGSKLKSSGTAFVAKDGVTHLYNVSLEGFEIEAQTGIDFSARQYDNYIFRIENMSFNCIDCCVNGAKCFQWYICNVKLYGTYGFVGIDGPANTFINIYEYNCVNMFVNCSGVFININASNSRNTENVFLYNDQRYGHSLTVLNSNFENINGRILYRTGSNGLSNLTFIGLTVETPLVDDYLILIENVIHVFIQIRQIPNNLSKFINCKNASYIKSFYINRDVPFAINGNDAKAPFFESAYDSTFLKLKSKFNDIESKLLNGCVVPIQEDVPLAYTFRISTGTLVNITPGTGADVAAIRPFYNPITGYSFMPVGTIITVKNSTGALLHFGVIDQDYTFSETGTLASNESASFVLKHTGSKFVWKMI